MQPIRRFGFDAAILFSDILVVPDALGSRCALPRPKAHGSMQLADPWRSRGLLWAIDHVRLASVYEAIAAGERDLPPAVALLGFCGGPWVVATYMIAGRAPGPVPRDCLPIGHPEAFTMLIDLLVEASVEPSGSAA